MEYRSESEQETEKIARALAEKLVPGDILCLEGDLGAGKSVFARALIRHLCGDPALEVPSPTYTLLQTYETPRGSLWHFDLYRLESEEEIYELGWEEALGGAIILAEWPQRLGRLLPEDRLSLLFEMPEGSAGARRITLTPQGSWKGRPL